MMPSNICCHDQVEASSSEKLHGQYRDILEVEEVLPNDRYKVGSLAGMRTRKRYY